MNINQEELGEFLIPADEMKEKLKSIKAFVFDWDGVFNNGRKGEGRTSDFSEVDSMGTNMLRFSHWLANNAQQPVSAIITGANNASAYSFAKREHFHEVYFNAKFKTAALEHLCQKYGVKPEEVCFFFDDILDLNMAALVGLRICVKRSGSPCMYPYIKEQKLADYFTGNSGNDHAVRESAELMMYLNDNFSKCVEERMKYTGEYAPYIQERNSIATLFHKFDTQTSTFEDVVV